MTTSAMIKKVFFFDISKRPTGLCKLLLTFTVFTIEKYVDFSNTSIKSV